MTAKKWVLMFIITALALGVCLLGLNWLADPYGVFGSPVFDWPSYGMTMNPRAAKITYIKDHADEYDSYILGCSSTSSFPKEELDELYGADFYNMIVYGADMLDTEQEARWLIDNCTVKNLIVNVYIDNCFEYATPPSGLSYSLPPEVTGENAVVYYLKYLFSDPRESVRKLRSFKKDTYMTQSFDVFNAETGSYDKKVRDAERISDLASYLESYPVFASYPQGKRQINRDAMAGTMESIGNIRRLCEERGIDLTVAAGPVYADYMAYFEPEQVKEFYCALAEVTPFWDFSYSSVSFEPRYFYDETHFRNSVGVMAAARMAGDESVYVPDDFGFYVTAENAKEHFDRVMGSKPLESLEATVPVLTYHHIATEGDSSVTVSEALFEEHMRYLSENGYTAVLPEDMENYVLKGGELPEKPVCITFDDGYLSNYELALPILEKYGMKATVFVIGSSIGKDTYKDTDNGIIPHFGYAEMEKMLASGVFTLGSHTDDMHQWAPYESGEARETILIHPGEEERDYIALLKEDCEAIREKITANTSQRELTVMSFPEGKYDALSEETLQEMGFTVSFGSDPGTAVLVKGLPQSLLAIKRNTVNETITAESLEKILNER